MITETLDSLLSELIGLEGFNLLISLLVAILLLILLLKR